MIKEAFFIILDSLVNILVAILSRTFFYVLCLSFSLISILELQWTFTSSILGFFSLYFFIFIFVKPTILNDIFYFKFGIKSQDIIVSDETNSQSENLINSIKNYAQKIAKENNYKDFPKIILSYEEPSSYNIYENIIFLHIQHLKKNYIWKAVLAHETAHYIQHKRHADSKTSTSMVSYIFLTLSLSLYGMPHITIPTIILLSIVDNYFYYKRSRKLEFDADLFSNKITRGKMLRFLKTMEKQSQEKHPLWKRTHPTLKERITYLENNKYQQPTRIFDLDVMLFHYMYQISKGKLDV